MESETASSTEEQAGGSGGVAGGVSDNRGKHRILAQLKHLEQEQKCLEDELEELSNTDSASTISAVLLKHVETVSDPLLPIINGPVNVIWDRWFEGTPDSHGCRCFIL